MKMPRVVPDQRSKFENEEFFRKLSRECEVSVCLCSQLDGNTASSESGRALAAPKVSRLQVISFIAFGGIKPTEVSKAGAARARAHSAVRAVALIKV